MTYVLLSKNLNMNRHWVSFTQRTSYSSTRPTLPYIAETYVLCYIKSVNCYTSLKYVPSHMKQTITTVERAEKRKGEEKKTLLMTVR